MKCGVLVYQAINGYLNAGDYIQSLAALQFLHEPVEFINREHLNEYNKNAVELIMNGWFLHEPKNWPPSAKINPLFVSFHLNTKAYEILNNPDAIAYFKKYEPIGCRDQATTSFLLNNGIKAYFSGCLTLTLGEKYKSNKKNRAIYFVDPAFEIKKDFISLLKYTKALLADFKNILSVCRRLYRSINFMDLLKAAAFYQQYSQIFEPSMLVKSEYLTHDLCDKSFTSETAKFDYARALVEKYASAELVITSRIHCALPCLGFGTPAIYIDNVNSTRSSACRLDGLIQLLHTIKYNNGEFSMGSLNLNTKRIGSNDVLANKDIHIEYKDALIKKCKEFIR